MKTQKTDRRSERTRRLIGEAFIALLREKRYEDITVQDVLDRANIGRSTFYTHYYDKEDLLDSHIEAMIDALSRHMEQAPGTTMLLIPSLGLFQHVQEQRRLYHAMMRGGGLEIHKRTVQAKLSQQVEQRLQATLRKPTPTLALTLAAQVVAGTFLTLLQWWAEHDMSISPKEMDKYFQQLVLPGIQEMLTDEVS